MHITSIVAFLCLAAQPCFSAASHPGLRNIYEFSNETWVENLAIRANGNILTTIIGKPEVWNVDPIAHTATLVYRFPNAESVTGIAEVSPDVFSVAVGNWSVPRGTGIPGSWSVWTLQLHPGQEKFHVQKATDIPHAVFLNGMTALPTEPYTALIGDSVLGLIYKVHALTGVYSTALDLAELKPNLTAAFVLGVNGIQSDGHHSLYFTNSFQPPFLARVPLAPNGSASGPVHTILARTPFATNLGGQADDFALDTAGNAWMTGDPSNYLVKVTPDGNATLIAGGSDMSVLAGDTAAHFDRFPGRGGRKTLYVVTNGGIALPPVSGVVGGKVYALDVWE
ncbi:hypothetical protein LTR15_012388 [Elasticomyces elasticus]|nr:hypothetical protein LTR15_012388 [Elasticomyces elasticus]